VQPFGFQLDGTLDSELIKLPLPENPEWVEKEEHRINAEMRMLSRSVLANHNDVLTGPWIEAWFRSR